jgi:P4 family phage/plasmid primase-like protien
MKALQKSTQLKEHSRKNDLKKPKSYEQFIKQFQIQKGETGDITNTRIGNKELGIYGGKFGIPSDKYADFLQLYHHETFVKNQPEYLTETQLKNGAILVDVDLRHDYSVTNRQFKDENVADLVDVYLGTFKETFQIDDEAQISAYIFQKPSVNRVVEDKITKDGLHIIFSVACDHIVQQIIRKKIIAGIDDIWNAEELKITNTWDKVFDEGISQGTTNWQLVGSRKPGNDAYRLTGIYIATFDSSDQEFSTVFANASTFDMAKDIYKLSARYPDHDEFIMTNSFLTEYNSMKESTGGTKRISKPNTNTLFTTYELDPYSIKTKEQLDSALQHYIGSVLRCSERYKEYEAYIYTMTLPPTYYDKGSYNKWFAVGCALKNTSTALFIVWLTFSSQSSVFNFQEDVANIWDIWQRLDQQKTKGLTFRSIYYWSKTDAPKKFKDAQPETINYYIDLSLDNGLTAFNVSDKKSQGATDWDIALVLRQMKKDEYVCASVKNNAWYNYRYHRWVLIDSGTSLRTIISTELRTMYGNKAREIQERCNELASELEDEEDKDDKDEKKFDDLTRHYNCLKQRVDKALEIYAKLGRTPDKRNIMEAARDLFYDEDFEQKIDTNEYLLCCPNGVWDFKENIFRDGKPDDYISITTNNDYIPLSDKDTDIIRQINEFFSQLFPVEELREYMWDHLSSTLVGTSVNQTFNNYLGGGRNGKSVLVTFMKKTLGEYKGELPLSAITSKRTQVGGLAPEIASLKGKRYVIMQEPREGDVMNESIMKELTSGTDAIQARSLYSTPITFLPQFKLAVCANVLPVINATDHGTWRRIRVVPFMALFTENPVKDDPNKPYQFKLDPSIDEKFDSWKQVFLSMLVNRILQTRGLVRDCPTVLQASNDYKMKQDIVAQFIEEKIERGHGIWLKQTDATRGFQIWHNDKFLCDPSKNLSKEFTTKMDKEFGAFVKTKGWKDIKLIYDNATQHTGPVDEEDAGDDYNE